MAQERLAPDAILAVSQLSGTVGAIQDDPDSPDASWLTASGNNTDTEVRVSFGTPTETLTTGAGVQNFRALVRKSVGSGTGTPTARIELWDNGTLISASSATNVTSALGQVISFSWDATGRTAATIEAKVYGTKSGGSPTVRASVDVGAVEWNADVTAAADGRLDVSHAVLETPDQPSGRLDISFAEMEVPDQPAGQLYVSQAFLELPSEPGRLELSFAELEVPDQPDGRVDVSFAELEVPDQPSGRIDVSHAVFETPDVAVEDGRLDVSWAALDVPDQPDGSVEVSFAAFEVPDQPDGRLFLSHAAFEVPSPDGRLDICWAEFECPDVGGEGCVRHNRSSRFVRSGGG